MAFYTKDEMRFLFFALFSCLPLHRCFRIARTPSPLVNDGECDGTTGKVAQSGRARYLGARRKEGYKCIVRRQNVRPRWAVLYARARWGSIHCRADNCSVNEAVAPTEGSRCVRRRTTMPVRRLGQAVCNVPRAFPDTQ